MYDKIYKHIGHRLEAVQYGGGVAVAIECIDCNEVIVDEDKEEPDENTRHLR